MNLRTVLLSILVASTLSAQLVERPAASGKPAGRTTTKPAASAPKAKDSPKDLLDLIKFPKGFRGALVAKNSDLAQLIFRGSWVPSPVISGSGTSTQWSSQAALLKDLDETGSNAFLLGFNLGRKDGKLVARLFQRTSMAQREVTTMDEAPLQDTDGGYCAEFEKSMLFLWPTTEAAWVPKKAHLYRYLVDGYNVMGQVQPRYNSPAFPGRTQRGLTFGGGSYLVLEDGPIGRVFFAPFGDANLQTARFIRSGEKQFLDLPRRPGASGEKQKGFMYYSHMWGDGLTGFGQDDSSALSNAIVTFKFRKAMALEEVASVSENPLFSFSLSGTSEEVPLEEAVKTEILDRAKDLGWSVSGGPYSLKRTLLRAFAGCTIQPPSLSRDDVRQSGLSDLRTGRNTSGPAYVKWGSDLYPQKLAEWAELAKEAGATFLSDRPSRPNSKTGAMGQITAPSAPRINAEQKSQKPNPTQNHGQAPVVFIAGSGPAPHYAYVVDELSAAFGEAKITSKSGEGSSRGACLEMANEAGAQSLLYVVASVSERLAYETFVTVQCLSADGTKLWEEEQKGPLMSGSVQSTIKSVTEKMVKKVRNHIGKPGLPLPKP